MNPNIFWHEALPSTPPPTQTDVLEKYDAVIVGAGLTGLNAARRLAQAGLTVAVLDAHEIGWGASSRNGGMVLPGFQQGLKTVFKKYGVELGTALWQASLKAVHGTADLIKQEGIDCNFTPNGYGYLASKPSHMDWMREEAEWFARTLDHTIQVVEPEDVSDVVGTDVFYGALVDDLGAGVQPAKFTDGLARAAASHGAYLIPNQRVMDVSAVGGGYRVKASNLTLNADHVLFATNGYSQNRGIKHQYIAVGSYIIVTEPLPDDVADRLVPKRRQLYDSKNFLNYFRLTPDNRVLWGGRNNLSTGLDLQKSRQLLQQTLVHTFPELADVAITHSWTGNLAVCVDKMPHIGKMDGGAYYALGYGGHGVAMSTYMGAEMAALVLGEKDTSPFLEIRAPSTLMHQLGSVFLPAASLYFRFRDMVS